METTFISIHDLTPEARILYTSDSIVDVLGWTPDDIVNRSAWDFFALEEAATAQIHHQRRVQADKAAVLVYCRLHNRDGDLVGCEVCFTVVYDVMVVCTSIYKQGMASEKRALEAPLVRRIFDSSPEDPRYHMLSHLSAKFQQPAKQEIHEPRAALFLNRFTRTLSIMYATTGIQEIIGIPAENMRGRSFYYCIAENCLSDAVKCLESAKANDSIAYLRFWFRDPRQDDQPLPPEHDDSDEEMTTEYSEDTDGGVGLHERPAHSVSSRSTTSDALQSSSGMEMDDDPGPNSRTSSGDSTREHESHEAIFGQSRTPQSSASSLTPMSDRSTSPRPAEPIELEAVISCTSDGLVVCLRRAKPLIPSSVSRPVPQSQRAGIFAAPWALEPILPTMKVRGGGSGPVFMAALGPQGMNKSMMAKANGPSPKDFMNAIREQAVFAWALTGINGSLASYSKGRAYGEAIPKNGLRVWASEAKTSPIDRPGPQFFGDPGLARDRQGSSGSRSVSSGRG